jgi:hypothetical protein
MRFLFYLSKLNLLYQVVRVILRSMLTPPRRSPQRPLGRPSEPRREERPEPFPPRRNARIDYSKVKDADYRDIG